MRERGSWCARTVACMLDFPTHKPCEVEVRSDGLMMSDTACVLFYSPELPVWCGWPPAGIRAKDLALSLFPEELYNWS